MIHSDIFERFVEDAPVCVMVQALMENALSPTTVDALFERHAELQYTRELLFSDIVSLMSLVVCGIRPSINSAYKKMAPVGIVRGWPRLLATGVAQRREVTAARTSDHVRLRRPV